MMEKGKVDRIELEFNFIKFPYVNLYTSYLFNEFHGDVLVAS